MTEDMNHKKHASALDNICLALNHKQAPLYPPKAETLHIKGAVEAGRTPAAGFGVKSGTTRPAVRIILAPSSIDISRAWHSDGST